MPYVKLFAGLGNQMFQYAYGLSLRNEGKTVRFIIDPVMHSLVGVFNLDDASIFELKSRWLRVILKIWAKYIARDYRIGFFQELAFAYYARHSFSFKRENEYRKHPYYEKISFTESVSVHIRGGDYLEESTESLYGGICNSSYYARALGYLKARIKDLKVFVFTNDTNYAHKTLGNDGGSCEFIQDTRYGNDPGFDLYLMKSCKHHVIANSTFSWWGAFLSERSGLTLCPENWTNDGSVSMKSLIPTYWIKIGGKEIIEAAQK